MYERNVALCQAPEIAYVAAPLIRSAPVVTPTTTPPATFSSETVQKFPRFAVASGSFGVAAAPKRIHTSFSGDAVRLGETAFEV